MQYRAMASVEKPTAPSNPAQYVSVAILARLETMRGADSSRSVATSRTNEEDEEHKDETMMPVPGHLLEGVAPKYVDVLRLLATDQIMHFDALAKLLPTRSEEELLDALEHVAVHVRGRLLPARYGVVVSLVTCSG